MGDSETRSFGQLNVKGYGATAPYQDMEEVEYEDKHYDEENGTTRGDDGNVRPSGNHPPQSFLTLISARLNSDVG